MAAEYDYLFLDCAPNISLVSESVFVAADALLVPTIPTTLSLRTLDQLCRHLDDRDKRRPMVMPFFCMIDRRKLLHRRISESTDSDTHGMLETRIPYSSVVEQMGLHRAPLAVFAGRSQPARAYEELWREIGSRLRP